MGLTFLKRKSRYNLSLHFLLSSDIFCVKKDAPTVLGINWSWYPRHDWGWVIHQSWLLSWWWYAHPMVRFCLCISPSWSGVHLLFFEKICDGSIAIGILGNVHLMGFSSSNDFFFMVPKSLMPVSIFIFFLVYGFSFWTDFVILRIIFKQSILIGVSNAYLKTNHHNKSLGIYKACVWCLHLKVTFVIIFLPFKFICHYSL